MSNKKYAIIGAGESGLAAAKYLKQKGITPVIFEKSFTFGGVWSPSSHAYEGLIANMSYYTMCFSDHYYPPNTPIIPKKTDVYEYLIDYVHKFGLDNLFRFNTKVTRVTLNDDKTWTVVYETLNDHTKEEIFDYLIIATGLHGKPKIPNFENMNMYEGILMHSSQFLLNDERLKSKKVLLIGASFSSSDLSANLVGHASEIINVFRKPYFICKKLISIKNADNTFSIKPIDFIFHTRSSAGLSSNEERIKKYSCMFPEQIELDSSHPLHINLKEVEYPKISISDFYYDYVKEGKIRAKKANVVRFEKKGVMFDDGSFEEADAVILCTGYEVNKSFLDENCLSILKDDPTRNKSPFILYNYTFHPDLPNFAFLNQERRINTLISIELQARLAVQVLTGEKKLPTRDEMVKEIDLVLEKRKSGDKDISYNGLMSLFANELNCEPDYEEIKINDPQLYRMLM